MYAYHLLELHFLAALFRASFTSVFLKLYIRGLVRGLTTVWKRDNILVRCLIVLTFGDRYKSITDP